MTCEQAGAQVGIKNKSERNTYIYKGGRQEILLLVCWLYYVMLCYFLYHGSQKDILFIHAELFIPGPRPHISQNVFLSHFRFIISSKWGKEYTPLYRLFVPCKGMQFGISCIRPLIIIRIDAVWVSCSCSSSQSSLSMIMWPPMGTIEVDLKPCLWYLSHLMRSS